MSAENVTYRCGTCDKPIKTGCYCSKKCAEADDPPAKSGADQSVNTRDECYVCHKAEEDDPEVELRPYGPNGAWLCFDCMIASPEREAAAKAVFGAQLDAAGPVAVATRDDPVPHHSLGRKPQ